MMLSSISYGHNRARLPVFFYKSIALTITFNFNVTYGKYDPMYFIFTLNDLLTTTAIAYCYYFQVKKLSKVLL